MNEKTTTTTAGKKLEPPFVTCGHDLAVPHFPKKTWAMCPVCHGGGVYDGTKLRQIEEGEDPRTLPQGYLVLQSLELDVVNDREHKKLKK